MDMLFETNVVQKHIDNILSRASELELQNNILKHQRNLAEYQAEAARKEAISWAKKADELEYELNLLKSAKLSGLICFENERR